MFLVLERLRGFRGEFKVINGVALALIVGLLFSTHYIVAVFVGIGYIFGNKIGGWGLWKGSLAVKREDGFILHNERDGGIYTGIQKLTEWLMPPTIENWLDHCRVALFLRGIWWWLPTLATLYFIGIGFNHLFLAVLLLSIGFPLSCEIGYYTSKLWNFKFMDGGSEHSEIWYGLMQDIVILGGLICGWVY